MTSLDDFPYWVLKGHTPVRGTRDEWNKMFSDTKSRTVGFTQIEHVRVSTVFLGMDHSFGSGLPVLFETMIFELGDEDEYQERYVTWDQAVEGHGRAVAHVLNRGYPKQKENP